MCEGVWCACCVYAVHVHDVSGYAYKVGVQAQVCVCVIICWIVSACMCIRKKESVHNSFKV